MAKRILHIGCGAIGSYSVLHLAGLVDSLMVCDLDVVSNENLGIAAFTPADVGRRKVSALADQMRSAHPFLSVAEVDGDVSRLSPAMIDSFDLLTAAVDNDRAAFTICRVVFQSATKPVIIFANCSPESGAAQIRILNFRSNLACLGCSRSHDRWASPASFPHSCIRGAARANAVAAQFAAAVQTAVATTLLADPDQGNARAGENLIMVPTTGVVSKSRLTLNEQCPAFFHYFPRTVDRTHPIGSVGQLRVAQVLDYAEKELGEDAYLELGERRCGDHFSCPRCNLEFHMLRFLDTYPVCSCGSLLTAERELRRLPVSLRRSPLARDTMGQCGFPEGDLALAVGNDSYVYYATEMSNACADAFKPRGQT